MKLTRNLKRRTLSKPLCTTKPDPSTTKSLILHFAVTTTIRIVLYGLTPTCYVGRSEGGGYLVPALGPGRHNAHLAAIMSAPLSDDQRTSQGSSAHLAAIMNAHRGDSEHASQRSALNDGAPTRCRSVFSVLRWHPALYLTCPTSDARSRWQAVTQGDAL